MATEAELRAEISRYQGLISEENAKIEQCNREKGKINVFLSTVLPPLREINNTNKSLKASALSSFELLEFKKQPDFVDTLDSIKVDFTTGITNLETQAHSRIAELDSLISQSRGKISQYNTKISELEVEISRLPGPCPPPSTPTPSATPSSTPSGPQPGPTPTLSATPTPSGTPTPSTTPTPKAATPKATINANANAPKGGKKGGPTFMM